ncbi:hypothetical protein KCTCHS21_55720 [Cohnella abietis]|uniref:Uncharacterized protein n=1 Tax=Cohnella abietis TaxID=2507935 RepID=A0A3T1DDK9_9BACL|nr:hypothetical protein KCTCHS21_55720 [Cohnella abietis]
MRTGSLMTLNKSVGNIYWLNIADNEIPFGGLIEHTNFISRNRFIDYWHRRGGVYYTGFCHNTYIECCLLSEWTFNQIT